MSTHTHAIRAIPSRFGAANEPNEMEREARIRALELEAEVQANERPGRRIGADEDVSFEAARKLEKRTRRIVENHRIYAKFSLLYGPFVSTENPAEELIVTAIDQNWRPDDFETCLRDIVARFGLRPIGARPGF